MNQFYFISFNLVSGQCAVERHLSDYITNKYHNTVIPDIHIDTVFRDIDTVFRDIAAEQERFLSVHRAAKPVPVHLSVCDDRFGRNKRIDVGDMYVTLTNIRSFMGIDICLDKKR